MGEKNDPLLTAMRAFCIVSNERHPAWLDTAIRIQDMPRYARFGPATPHRFMPLRRRASMMDVAKRCLWVTENCSGPWKVVHSGRPAFFFLSDEDAVLYRLRWADEDQPRRKRR